MVEDVGKTKLKCRTCPIKGYSPEICSICLKKATKGPVICKKAKFRPPVYTTLAKEGDNRGSCGCWWNCG